MPNLVILGQTLRAYLRDSPEYLGSSRPAFQGHSVSSERSIGYLWLPISDP